MRNFGKLFLALTFASLFATGFNARSQVEVSVGADL